MIILLDASAGCEAAFSGDLSRRVRHVLQEADLCLAPDSYSVESANVFGKYSKRSEISQTDATAALRFTNSLIGKMLPSRELLVESLNLGLRERHPVYDCLYVVAARREGATLLTLDKNLAALAKKAGVDSILIS